MREGGGGVRRAGREDNGKVGGTAHTGPGREPVSQVASKASSTLYVNLILCRYHKFVHGYWTPDIILGILRIYTLCHVEVSLFETTL